MNGCMYNMYVCIYVWMDGCFSGTETSYCWEVKWSLVLEAEGFAFGCFLPPQLLFTLLHFLNIQSYKENHWLRGAAPLTRTSPRSDKTVLNEVSH